MVQKKTLFSIPPEILEAVADEVQPSDLLALRLVSRAICNAIDRPFLREFFTVRNHLITPDSLKDLIHITATPRLCKTIEKLSFGAPTLSCKTHPHGTCLPPCTSCVVWAAWRQADSQLNDRMGSWVEQALRNIALTQEGHHLSLRIEEWPGKRMRFQWGTRAYGKASFERYLTAPLHSPDSYSDSYLHVATDGRMTLIILRAIAETGVSLQELHLPRDTTFMAMGDRHQKEIDDQEYPDWFTDLQHRIAPSFSNIHTIQLGEYVQRWMPPLCNENLQDIVANWFPNLTSVTVMCYTDVRRLIAAFPAGKFKKIGILGDDYGFRYDKMASFLKHHQSSLVHVSLSEMLFTSHCERVNQKIQNFIQWISDNCDLQTFELRGLKWGDGTRVPEAFKFEWYNREEVSTFLESGYLAAAPAGSSALVE